MAQDFDDRLHEDTFNPNAKQASPSGDKVH